MKITIYQKPACTTCRKVYDILREAGVETESVNYYITPLGSGKIVELLRKMRIPARDLLRARAAEYVKFGLSDPAKTEKELVDLMSKYPDLIQRPIVEKGKRAILARPPERIREIL